MVKKARIIEDLGEAYGPLTSTLTPAYQASSTVPVAPPAAPSAGSTAAPTTGGLTSVVVPAGTTAAAAPTTSAATTAPTVNKAPADIRAAVGDTKQKGITPFLGAAGAIGANALLTSILGGNKDMPSLLDKAKAAINNDIVGAAKDKLTSILNTATNTATKPTPNTSTTTPATKPAATTTTTPKTGTTPASSTNPLTSAIVGGITKGLTGGTKPAAEEETGEEEEVAEEEGEGETQVAEGEGDEGDEQVAVDDGVVVDDGQEDVAFKDDDLNEDIYVADKDADSDTVAVNDTLDDFDESGMDSAVMPGTSNALDGGEAQEAENSTASAEQLQQLLSTPEGEEILRQVMISSALESDASLADDPDFEAKIDEAMDQLRNMSTDDISSTIRGESPLQQVANESSNAIQEAADNSLSNLVGEQSDQASAETSPLTQVAQETTPAPAPETAPAPEQQQPSPLTQVAQEQPAPAPAPAPEQQQQAPLTQVAQQQPQTPVEQATQQAQETMNSSPLTQAMDNMSNAAAEPEVDYDKLFEDYMNSINQPDTSMPDFSVPDFTMPDLSMPDYQMPELTMPDFSLPDFNMPDFSMPDFDMPDFSTPDFSYDYGGYDSYDPGSYDYGSYDNSYDYDYKRGGRVMRMKKGGLSSIRHFEDGGYTDTSEEVQDWQNVDSGTDTQTIGYTNTDEEVQDWQNVTDNLNVDDLDPEDVGDGVTAYRDGDGNVVKVIGADGKNVTDQYITPTGQIKPGTGLRGSPQATSTTTTNPATRTTTTTNNTTGTQNQNNPAATSFLTDIQNLLTNPAVKTGITGALLAELLSGQDDKSNKGVNVGSYAGFAPRTTPFGMGPTRQVSLGPANALPPQQNTQLMASLGVPGYGFKPPTPTPYTEPVQIQYPGTAPAPEPKPALPTMVARGGLVHLADGGMATGGDPNADPQAGPGTAGQTGGTHYTFGVAVDPLQVLGVRKASGGLTSVSEVKADVPLVQGRKDYRQGAYVTGAGDGQSDDIPAMLADGEYVIDAELVSMLGNGSNKAGAKVLDKFRQQIREHKRSAPLNKIPPKAKSPLAYLKGVK